MNINQVQQEYESQLADEFLLDFIIERSKELFIVVNTMTLNEQKYISNILNKLEVRLNSQQIMVYIIHNFSQVGAVEALDKMINKDILSSFQVVLAQSKKNDHLTYELKYFVSEKFKGQVYHFVMAKDDSQVGRIYNDQTVKWLQEIIW